MESESSDNNLNPAREKKTNHKKKPHGTETHLQALAKNCPPAASVKDMEMAPKVEREGRLFLQTYRYAVMSCAAIS